MDRSKENSKAAFDRQAAGYDQGACGQHARSLYPLLLAKLARIPFHTALDLGCGTGEMIRLLLEADPGRKLFGLDLSEEMLSVARAKLQGRAALTVGDSERLPYPDGMFDVVYCNDSFHHYPAPEKVLGEVFRVLRPGGTFLLGDCWQPPVGRAIMNVYMRHSKTGDVKIYSRKELTALLAEYFHDVTWERAGLTPCIASGRKGA